MNDKRSTFCLFFPQPLDEIDKGNILASGVRRVQLFLGVAYNNQDELRWLAAHNISVVFRIEEPARDFSGDVGPSYYLADGRLAILRKLDAIRANVPGLVVEALICGNEPEIGYELRRSDDPHANWGDKPEPMFLHGRAWDHQYGVGQLRLLVSPMLVVAPGWSHKRLTPRDWPEPGRAFWGRACGDVYNAGPAGLHAYAINWLGDEDKNRYLWHVGHELERIQGEAWINETNVAAHGLSDLQRMQAVMEMYDLLAAQEWSAPIKSFAPFVSNGLPGQSWSHLIMRGLEAYQALGRSLGAAQGQT